MSPMHTAGRDIGLGSHPAPTPGAKKFRKKPVVIEAFAVSDAIRCATNNWRDMPEWLRAAYEKGDVIFSPSEVHIRTLEGMHTGDKESWIICGTHGELYPIKGDIFRANYEAVD